MSARAGEQRPGTRAGQTKRGFEIEADEPTLLELAERLGEAASENDLFVALYGPLGAGKSTLIRRACRQIGVEGPVPSPTFTLINRYSSPSGRWIHHVDLYRLESEKEIWDLGWADLVTAEGPVFVEWADRAGALLPAHRWDVTLAIADSPDRRIVTIEPRGAAPEVAFSHVTDRQTTS